MTHIHTHARTLARTRTHAHTYTYKHVLTAHRGQAVGLDLLKEEEMDGASDDQLWSDV